MTVPSVGRWARALVVAMAACAVGGSFVPASEPVQAQIRIGSYRIVQPHQGEAVGWAWTNAGRTVEYWAYVEGEYRWAEICNGPSNPWHLSAESVPSCGYDSFEAFQAAVRAMPQFAGKRLIFQNHSVVETVVQN